jgi:mRNA interferase YafQ
MREVIFSARFKREYKRALKRGCDASRLEEALHCLMAGTPLPDRFRPHKLVGEYTGFWECHLAPDWLLIYDIDDETLVLTRTGTHADLFK